MSERTFVQVELRWTPVEHQPLARAPSSPLWYLATPLPDGYWQCYPGIDLAVDRFWEEPAFLVSSETLETQFNIFPGVIENVEDLFVRALPADPNTYHIKDALRTLGGLWMRHLRAWAIPVNRFDEACALLEATRKETLP